MGVGVSEVFASRKRRENMGLLAACLAYFISFSGGLTEIFSFPEFDYSLLPTTASSLLSFSTFSLLSTLNP